MENRLTHKYCATGTSFNYFFYKVNDSTYINYRPNKELSVLYVKIDNIKNI